MRSQRVRVAVGHKCQEPRHTSAEAPDGGNSHVRFPPGLSRSGLRNNRIPTLISGGFALMLACGSEQAPRIKVYGSDMGGLYENVHVLRSDGTGIREASVQVEGIALTTSTTEFGYYSGRLSTPRVAGQTISVTVIAEGATVTGSGTVPEAPVLISPVDGETLSTGADVAVSWTSSTDPNRFLVSAQWSCGPVCGTGQRFAAAGSGRSLIIPGGSIPSGAISIRVFAYNDGALAGDYVSFPQYPGMNIRADSNTATVSR